ncbi:hypothetical protein [Flavobacterium crassostreae]|uniref:Uncharacterized protein n=1 Tax=Flavobacterium crassostreae TaxID=1763534 RepID=A0A1B9E7J0_9FLAO|nr:hypothetical protein [Flavobacterium crassostreae]OCB77909.1 hypothetical protein LPBF_02875 [Flavobacterium crassostreae]
MSYINNEFENNNNSHRGKSRLQLFRRILRVANRTNCIGAFGTNNQRDFRGISVSITKQFGNNKSKDTEKTESEKGRIETGQSTK